MKVIALAAMKEENILPADKTFECRGSIIADGEKYSCLEPHGRIDLVRALGLSCNVAFVQASSHLSPEMFLEYARRFGLNKPVAKYASGLFPSHAEEPARHYVLGTSDKFQPQPLQIMRMCALIAGKGILPYLHDASDTTASGRPFRIVLRDTTWTALEQGMQMAGRLGTAKKLDPTNKLHLAVKTGTAMHGTTFQSWVAGYFPYEEPRYAFCLRAYSGTSQQAAVPLAAKYLLSTEWP